MLRRLSAGLLASVVAIAPMPLKAQDGSADDLGDAMSISLKDAVKFNWGFQGSTQGAGTPNQSGVGGFLPLKVNDQSIWFLDAQINVDLPDRSEYSSLINTTVAGPTISTSTRVGYRWLDFDRTWLFGVNAGYDSRPLNTGQDDKGLPLFGTEQDVFFQQIAVGAEAKNENFGLNIYALYPIGDTEEVLNLWYSGGALKTYGTDLSYSFTDDISASIGYYYQHGDLTFADGSGVSAELDIALFDGLTFGFMYSYDEAFEDRVSANITYRYGGDSSKGNKANNLIEALSEPVSHRNVRVHDCAHWYDLGCEASEAYDEMKTIIDGMISIGAYKAFEYFYKTWKGVNDDISDAVADLRETAISNLEEEGLDVDANLLSEMEELADFDISEWCAAIGSSWCETQTGYGEGEAQGVMEDLLGIDEDSFTAGDLILGLTNLYEATTFDAEAAELVGVTGFVEGFIDAVTALFSAAD